MKRLIVFILVLTRGLFVEAQDTLDLFECIRAMKNNYPKSGEIELIQKQNELQLKNFQSEWYPQVDFNAQATYQSDVVEVGFEGQLPFPVDFPTASKDQYKATLDIRQIIYDGGATRSSKKVEQLQTDMNSQSVTVDLHQVKNNIAKVYFGVLLLQKQKNILLTTMEELNTKKAAIQAGVDNGALLVSDLQTLKAEQLRLDQEIDEVQNSIQANMQVLEKLTGLQIAESDSLFLPEVEITGNKTLSRPENKIFEIQKKQLDASEEVLKSQKMPKLYAFGQLGYGKPGLNMLQDEFDSYYIVGAKLSWNLWDWNKNKRNRQQLEVQKKIVDVHNETFNKNIQVTLEQIQADIANYSQAAKRDEEIISLREHVISSAKSKLENGVITSAEYISDLNMLKKAKLTYERHKIELVKSKIDYLLTIGELENIEQTIK